MATRTIDNLAINEEDRSVTARVNPRLYPLEVVYSAAYALLDHAYVYLDGDPQQEILVKMRYTQPPQTGRDLELLGREFNNELLNYMTYAIQAERNKAVRDAIVQRALLTNAAAETGGPQNETKTGAANTLPDSKEGNAPAV